MQAPRHARNFHLEMRPRGSLFDNVIRVSEAARIPKLADDLELTSLEITPFEGFILSRIDGRTTLQDIADSTGSTKEAVVALLTRLGAAIEWVGESPRVTSRTSGTTKKPAKHTPARGIVRTKPAPPGASRVLYDPTELEEDVDLDIDRRRAILDMFYRLEEMDHYEILGVSRKAEKREIRDAYFALSKQFHPDTLFGKRLGSYKTKMEGVFKSLTDAYDVLSKKKKRAKYDEYLEAHDRLMGVERGLEDGERAADDLEREVRETVEGAVVMPSTVRESDPPPSDPPPPAPESRPPTPSKAPTTPPRATAQERKRRARALLEKRMGRTVPPPSRPPPPRESKHPTSRDDLLRGLATSLKQVARITGGVERVERHVADAAAAEKAGDLVGAVNALRLGLALDPERTDIATKMEVLRKQLTTQLADTYEKQALYEEEQENWAAAARSWAKVTEGRPGRAQAPRRAAEALLKAEGDLRKARDFAQLAVDLQPSSVPNRLVLAQVFLAAGMSVSAAKELDEAARLDPKDEMVKNLQRQLK